jgi:hypothetical protein
MRNSGADFMRTNDFKKPIYPENEKLALQFLMSFCESTLAKYKPTSHY